MRFNPFSPHKPFRAKVTRIEAHSNFARARSGFTAYCCAEFGNNHVKTIYSIFLCLALARAANAQEELELAPADSLQQANQWLSENLDDSALDALGVDKDRAQRFFAELQKRFQGTYVYDLGALRDTA